MFKSFMKKFYILNIFYSSIINLPTPINISIWWNFGSLLGICLSMQIITGLFLSMHYCPNNKLAFNSLMHIIQDINKGWLIQLLHMNGASIFFFCMFCHIGRGIYYNSFMLINVWIIGVMIFLISMATAFMGYVLPWGQMSFWGATVITNLISTIPYIGKMMVEWIWGSFSIDNPTLNRFFTFHFILPFIILSMVMIHLLFIHETGSNNPLGLNSNLYMIKFHNYFTIKDIIGFLIMWMIMLMLISISPYKLSDPENFIPANPMITPPHIQPEWYFLFAYSILRSIPNKLGGVIALLYSILILLMLPILSMNLYQKTCFYPLNQIMFWMFINNVMILTWLGGQLIEIPYINISIYMTISYFMFYLCNNLISILWDWIIN